MLKPCERCGKQFQAKRSTAKYCGSTCRSQASLIRAAGGEVVALTFAEPPADDEPEDESLAETTRRTLKEAKVERTVSGRAAIALAKRVDAGQDTGSAMATMVSQLEKSVDRALSSGKSKSWLDELKDERDDIYCAG